jgi:hypothetical protein
MRCTMSEAPTRTPRYGFMVSRLPHVLAGAQAATQSRDADAQHRSFAPLALSYQATAVLLTEIGEVDLAWIAAERGFAAASAAATRSSSARCSGRWLTHCSRPAGTGRRPSPPTTRRHSCSPAWPMPARSTCRCTGRCSWPARWRRHGAEDRASVRAFLDEADDAARRLGRDANHLGTAFGPTNVSIHRVATAMDLGDVQVAIDLGPRVDTTGLPVERQVRHALGTARALSARNRTDNTLATVLAAKQKAPEQVRHHAISRQLVQTWMRRGRAGRPGRRHRHHCRAWAAGPRQPPGADTGQVRCADRLTHRHPAPRCYDGARRRAGPPGGLGRADQARPRRAKEPAPAGAGMGDR